MIRGFVIGWRMRGVDMWNEVLVKAIYFAKSENRSINIVYCIEQIYKNNQI